MPHSIEPAASGRAKCRGCSKPIAKGELRLGERMPNPFAEDAEMVLWFHLQCAAFKRPEPLLDALASTEEDVGERDALEAAARNGVEYRRLPRVDGAQVAPTGRAKCRCCREPISKGSWRVRLVWYEDGRFDPSGFVHMGCAEEYFGTAEILDRLQHFASELGNEDVAAVERALRSA